MCFNPKVDYFELGKDLNISMFLSWTDFTNRDDGNKLWDNEVNEYSSVKLSKILTTYNGYCYQLKNTSNKNVDRKSTWHVINIEFDNKTVSKLPTVQVYLTSENNSYGILTTHWLDGEALFFQINPSIQRFVEFGLREEQFVYLPEKLKCRKKSLFGFSFANCVSIFVKSLKGFIELYFEKVNQRPIQNSQWN